MSREIAKTHKYWSRKPAEVIRTYIEKYSEEQDVVLDPFCGSGTTGIQSIILGRNFIGYDLNPIAIAISDFSLDKTIDLDNFEEDLNLLKNKLHEKLMLLYKVDNGQFILYSRKVPKESKIILNLCNSEFKRLSTSELIGEISYGLNSKLRKAEIPDRKFPEKFYKDRFSYKGVSNVSDLFSTRNLEALSILRSEIELGGYSFKSIYRMALTNTLLHVSKLKSESIRPLGVNNYWIPDDYIDENVWWRFLDRVSDIVKSKQYLKSEFETKKTHVDSNVKLYNKSCLPMSEVSDEQVDYIMTDPPYGDVIQYGELSFIWNTWLGKEMRFEEEIVVNPKRGMDEAHFLSKLEVFLIECKRVLKPGRKMTISFQNKDLDIWFKFVELMAKLNFKLVDVSTNEYHGNPFNKNWSTKSPKMDIYLTIEKPSKSVKRPENGIMDSETLFNSFEIGAKFSSRLNAMNAIVRNGIQLIFDGYSYKAISKKQIIGLCESLVEDKNDQDRQATLF